MELRQVQALEKLGIIPKMLIRNILLELRLMLLKSINNIRLELKSMLILKQKVPGKIGINMLKVLEDGKSHNLRWDIIIIDIIVEIESIEVE